MKSSTRYRLNCKKYIVASKYNNENEFNIFEYSKSFFNKICDLFKIRKPSKRYSGNKL